MVPRAGEQRHRPLILPDAAAADTQQVDIRVKTFTHEAVKQLGLPGEPVRLRRARRQSRDIPRDHVSVTQRTEIARNTAHTGYQMRRALKLQAEALRAAIHQA
jgi:hypothetical protein